MIVGKRVRRDTARLLTVSPDSQSCNGPGTYDGTAETEERRERETLVNLSKSVSSNNITWVIRKAILKNVKCLKSRHANFFSFLLLFFLI